MPFGPSLYQASPGITRELVRSAESRAPAQAQGIHRRNGPALQETQTTCFKAVTGRAGEVCADNTPATTLPRGSRGPEEGTEASAF